jgi:hypothetical protein
MAALAVLAVLAACGEGDDTQPVTETVSSAMPRTTAQGIDLVNDGMSITARFGGDVLAAPLDLVAAPPLAMDFVVAPGERFTLFAVAAPEPIASVTLFDDDGLPVDRVSPVDGVAMLAGLGGWLQLEARDAADQTVAACPAAGVTIDGEVFRCSLLPGSLDG